MKNFIPKWIPPALFLLFTLAISSTAGVISVVAPVRAPNIGDLFPVNIEATNLSDVYAFQFDLVFDPVVLSVLSTNEGEFLPSGGTTVFINGTIDNTGGSVTDIADSLTGLIPGVTGSGTLVQIEFAAISSGVSTVSLENEVLLDSSLNDITSGTTFQNGSVTVSASSAVPEPQNFGLLCCGLIAILFVARSIANGNLTK